MKIGQTEIRPDGWDLPYLIAEIGVNHGGDIHRAERMIEDAADGGANAVKFQVYQADKLASKHSPTYFTQTGPNAQTQWEFFKRYDRLTQKHYEHLAQVAERVGVDFLVTPFHVEDIPWLDPLVPAWKIASGDITNRPLLEAVARTGKPVILSTGASAVEEVYDAQRILWSQGDGLRFAFLHCTLAYPTTWEDCNLSALSVLSTRFPDRVIGWSDHVADPAEGAVIPAWLLGARIIEKHFTDNRDQDGNDHYHAWTKHSLRTTIASLKGLQDCIGHGRKEVLPCEEPARLHARRSWHTTRMIPAGLTIRPEDIAPKRPGHGISPMESIVGRKLTVSLEADQAILPEHLAVDLRDAA